MLTRTFWLGAAGVVATVIGFSRTIEPLIELGVALFAMALISRPKG